MTISLMVLTLMKKPDDNSTANLSYPFFSSISGFLVYLHCLAWSYPPFTYLSLFTQ